MRLWPDQLSAPRMRTHTRTHTHTHTHVPTISISLSISLSLSLSLSKRYLIGGKSKFSLQVPVIPLGAVSRMSACWKENRCPSCGAIDPRQANLRCSLHLREQCLHCTSRDAHNDNAVWWVTAQEFCAKTYNTCRNPNVISRVGSQVCQEMNFNWLGFVAMKSGSHSISPSSQDEKNPKPFLSSAGHRGCLLDCDV